MHDEQRPIRVVELSTVTDETLEDVLNEWIGRGYHLEGIHFAMRDSSRRPAMAFIVFQRSSEPRKS
jgi:type 1 glutamine amidotransferase